MSNKPITGVTALFIIEGRVLAHATSFELSTPGGLTLEEAQTYRAKRQLAFEVVKALASPRLYERLDAHDCENIMAKIDGRVQIVPVSANESTGEPHVK